MKRTVDVNNFQNNFRSIIQVKLQVMIGTRVIGYDSAGFLFFFRMLAQSYTPNIYTPTPIPLLYNPFTIVLHKRLSAYMFRAAQTVRTQCRAQPKDPNARKGTRPGREKKEGHSFA